MSFRQISFLGLGDTYLGPADGGGANVPIGSCSQVQFGVTEDEKAQPNYGRAGGQLSNIKRISAVTINLTMQNLSPRNLARALRGTVKDIESGTVSDETVTAYPDGLIRLANIDPADVVVTDADTGETTYTAGTDYKVTSAGIVAHADGAIFTDVADPGKGVAIKVAYSYSGRSVVEALTKSAAEYVMFFDGLNEADSGRSCVIDAWKVKFGVPDSLDVVGDDYITLSIAGAVLADPSKGTGESAFFRWNYAA